MFQSRFVGMTICMCTMPRNTPLALVTMRNGIVPPLTFQLHIIIIIISTAEHRCVQRFPSQPIPLIAQIIKIKIAPDCQVNDIIECLYLLGHHN